MIIHVLLASTALASATLSELGMECCSLRLRSASGVMERCSLSGVEMSGEWNVARFGYAQRAG
ncbi:MAG: hypothetical protein PHQ33_01830 [Bacteroidales bacterium]|nr:hypothetical protein [Bacteroidales bacterium]